MTTLAIGERARFRLPSASRGGKLPTFRVKAPPCRNEIHERWQPRLVYLVEQRPASVIRAAESSVQRHGKAKTPARALP